MAVKRFDSVSVAWCLKGEIDWRGGENGSGAKVVSIGDGDTSQYGIERSSRDIARG
ncbi:hypothetical protein [Haladaptatus caseinilyticus]|uniref:hypothetical protein n=1 Tax=Haladaptatus caseinilyticus TaxID=2993314 RepID=UPI00224B8659|nr:hypothetical protein [Haladaptatus caseinilyticus]